MNDETEGVPRNHDERTTGLRPVLGTFDPHRLRRVGPAAPVQRRLRYVSPLTVAGYILIKSFLAVTHVSLRTPLPVEARIVSLATRLKSKTRCSKTQESTLNPLPFHSDGVPPHISTLTSILLLSKRAGDAPCPPRFQPIQHTGILPLTRQSESRSESSSCSGHAPVEQSPRSC